MSAPHRALIVVDAQQEYFTGKLPIQYPPREETVRRIGAAVDAAEAAGLPVVMVQHTSGDDAPAFNPTRPEYRLHPSLEERESAHWQRLVKERSSVFSGTDLAARLREAGVDTVTFAGYMTNNCVLASVVESETHEFTAEVLADATGAVDLTNAAGSADARTVHTTLLTLFHSNLAAVTTTEAWATAVADARPLSRSNLLDSAAATVDTPA